MDKNVKYVESIKDPLVGWYEMYCCDKCGWKFHNRDEKKYYCERCGILFNWGDVITDNKK